MCLDLGNNLRKLDALGNYNIHLIDQDIGLLILSNELLDYLMGEPGVDHRGMFHLEVILSHLVFLSRSSHKPNARAAIVGLTIISAHKRTALESAYHPASNTHNGTYL